MKVLARKCVPLCLLVVFWPIPLMPPPRGVKYRSMISYGLRDWRW